MLWSIRVIDYINVIGNQATSAWKWVTVLYMPQWHAADTFSEVAWCVGVNTPCADRLTTDNNTLLHERQLNVILQCRRLIAPGVSVSVLCDL